jgi:uncharacterized membrane protein (UPF0127 family)
VKRRDAFIFETPLVTSFWMKNMQFSIDIIFIDETRQLYNIEKNVPHAMKILPSLFISI